MKTRDKKSLQELSLTKLTERLKEARREYLDFLLQQKIRKIKDVHAAFKKRKEIAQILTFINSKRKKLELKNGQTN